MGKNILWFHEITLNDVPRVGGKNASLGEMFRELVPKGVKIPNGFAITADAYREFIRSNSLDQIIRDILGGLKTKGYTDKPQYFIDKLSQGVATIAAKETPVLQGAHE